MWRHRLLQHTCYNTQCRDTGSKNRKVCNLLFHRGYIFVSNLTVI